MSTIEKNTLSTATELLVSRVEHKYIISKADAILLAQKLALLMKPDVHNGTKGYTVRSLYFDTAHNTDFYAKYDGLYTRQKMRLRIYDTRQNSVKLECKAKSGDYQQKTSLVLDKSKAKQLIKGNYGVLLEDNSTTALEMYRKIQGYRPVVMIEYNRKAFFWPANETRITIDSDVKSSEVDYDLFSDNISFTPVLEGGNRILEVKYNGKLEPAIAQLLAGQHRTRLSFSKYNSSRRSLNAIY